MFRKYRSRVATCLSLCVLLTGGTSFADYIGKYFSLDLSLPFGGGIRRITDSGSTVPTNFVGNVQGPFGDNEDFVEAFAVTPDLQKVYAFTNTLGFANHVLAWDTATSAFRPSDSFSPSANFPPPDDYVANAYQPMIVGNEIFVLSRILRNGSFTNDWQVKRFDLTTHALVQTVNPFTPQVLDDLALDPSGSSLYVAGSSGIYRYTKTLGSYSLATPPIILGVDGNIAYGPNNLLYVRNFANGDVQRYTATGTFLDTLISHNDYPGLGTIQFGVDGNLHIYQDLGTNDQIRKFDPSTGVLLSSTPLGPPISSPIVNGRIFYIPVPEPGAVLLLATCAMLLLPFRAKRNA